MKISELEKALKDFREYHGDIEVVLTVAPVKEIISYEHFFLSEDERDGKTELSLQNFPY